MAPEAEKKRDKLVENARRHGRKQLKGREYTLADGEHLWCAYCLKDDDEKPEAHHLLSLSPAVHGVFAGLSQVPTRRWVVPACRTCHKEHLDVWAMALTEWLNTKTEPSTDYNVLAQTAKEAHAQGCHAIALLLNYNRSRRAAKSGNESTLLEVTRYCQASASATYWGDHFLKEAMLNQGAPPGARDDMAFCVNDAKIAAIAGRWTEAKRALDEWDEKLARRGRRTSEEMRASFLRAKVSICSHVPRSESYGFDLRPVVADAEEAVKISPDSYTRLTSRLLLAQLHYKCGDEDGIRRARGQFETLLEQPNRLPWQYEGMAYFFRALLRINEGKCDQAIYKDLVAAQYIFCMLGLQGHSHRGAEQLFSGLPSNCMPGHILARLRLSSTRPERERRWRWRLRQAALASVPRESDRDPIRKRVLRALGEYEPGPA